MGWCSAAGVHTCAVLRVPLAEHVPFSAQHVPVYALLSGRSNRRQTRVWAAALTALLQMNDSRRYCSSQLFSIPARSQRLKALNSDFELISECYIPLLV